MIQNRIIMRSQPARARTIGKFSPGTLAQGTPVDLKLMFWGVSLVAIAAFLFGQRRPAVERKTKRDGGTAADSEAVSALVNLGYSRADSTRAVLAAQRSGARGFNAIFERAQRRLE